MQKAKIKSLLQALLTEAKDASMRDQIKELINELDAPGKTQEAENPSVIPKKTPKKVVEFIGKFFLKLAEYKAIRWIWEILDHLDDHRHP